MLKCSLPGLTKSTARLLCFQRRSPVCQVPKSSSSRTCFTCGSLQRSCGTGEGSRDEVFGIRRKSSSRSPTFSPSSAVSIITSPEHELYQKGLRGFNTRQYDNATKIFNDVLQQYPSGKYPDNCHYWIGECLYAKGDFTGAITSFQKVLSYQNSGKADDAQIKIGLCYLKMGQTGAAKDEFKKLKDRYPASEYVPRAEKYLSDLK